MSNVDHLVKMANQIEASSAPRQIAMLRWKVF